MNKTIKHVIILLIGILIGTLINILVLKYQDILQADYDITNLYKEAPTKKNFLVAMIPATLMSAVTFTYILQAPEGLKLSTAISYPAGIAFALVCLLLYYQKRGK